MRRGWASPWWTHLGLAGCNNYILGQSWACQPSQRPSVVSSWNMHLAFPFQILKDLSVFWDLCYRPVWVSVAVYLLGAQKQSQASLWLNTVIRSANNLCHWFLSNMTYIFSLVYATVHSNWSVLFVKCNTDIHRSFLYLLKSNWVYPLLCINDMCFLWEIIFVALAVVCSLITVGRNISSPYLSCIFLLSSL